MNQKIEEFRISIKDAWYRYDYGLDTIIESEISGRVLLRCLVKEKPITITIDEDKLISTIEKTPWKKWDKRFYDCHGEDGWYWRLSAKWSDNYFMTGGHNVFPKDVQIITDYLRELGLSKDDLWLFYRKDNIYEIAKKKYSIEVKEDYYSGGQAAYF